MWGCHDFDAASGTFQKREDLERALARVRPSRVAGWPTRIAFDRASGNFELEFRGNPGVAADHQIAIARVLGPAQSVLCDDAAADWETLDADHVRVRCGRGSSAAHRIRVNVTPLP
jgi:hypothetical protein